MALERQSIEKKDFPIGRRGYDPEAVDAHLSSLADEIEQLKVSARRRTETVASAASDQVRAIVDAAETTAAEIQKQAEEDAQDARAEAAAEAQSTREKATAQAREYVGKVSQSTSVMLQRLDAMESELVALIDALRIGSNRLNADLQLLENNLAEVQDAAGLHEPFEPEAAEAAAAELEAAAVAELVPEPAVSVAASDVAALEEEEEEEEEEAEAFAEELEEDDAEPYVLAEDANGAVLAEAGAAGRSDDVEGARLIALNMALTGTPREETDRYLAENFTLADRAQLLDEVYATVEG